MYKPDKPYIEGILRLTSSTLKDEIVPPASVDGIGTKGTYLWRKRAFRNAALDSFAGNANDMGVLRANISYLQDHIMLPMEDEEAIFEIVETLVDECKKRKIEINAGETSIHNNMNGLEISVSMQGEYARLRENKFRDGDYLVGIASSGLHDNGFTRVMEVYGDEFRKEFIEPAFIYYDKILELDDKFNIHGMVNITGGAFTRIKKVLDSNDAIITQDHNLKPQNIFSELYGRGVSDREMYKIFNCGIGFILSVSEKDSFKIVDEIKNDFDSDVIGKVEDGKGVVRIESMFSQKEVEF